MDFRPQLKKGTIAGLKKGWNGFLWMMKIIIPISLMTSILDWSGLMHRLDFLLKPLMGLFSLPPAAALPLVIGMLSSVYGGLAAMVAIPFSTPQMTLMAVFILMAHALIQEGIIQGKSGIHPLKATLVRIGAALVTLLLMVPWVGSSTVMPAAAEGALSASPAFPEMIRHWAWTTFRLTAKIFVIIMVLLTFLELLKAFGWIHPFVRALGPFLRIMGLDQKVGFLWMTAVIFGLSYGGAIIVEEAKSGHLSKDDLEILHLSIGMNHSMVEDPPLFLPMGIHPFWLYVPRLVMAIVTVRLLRLWQRYARRPHPAA
ncbi:MAG: iron transporter [Proteobacteria bacterium]|nr:iron transporter [Pseudomonadota bacterium]MBU2234670.1 iron transporter [Pseudomonadota bacterium]MBU4074212.1 iron transporter [Pseudomonadota bacterium]